MRKEIMKLVREKGLLLGSEIYELLESFHDSKKAREFLEEIERESGQKMITKSVLNSNVEYIKEFVSKLNNEEKGVVERVIFRMGVKMEVERSREAVGEIRDDKREQANFKVFYADTKPDKKIEVKDFVGHFRARYEQLRSILANRPEFRGELRSINKISSDRQSLSIIGIVSEKRVTKNKNLIIKFEDLTGEISGIVKHESEIFEKASELQLDDVVGIRASGSSEMLFVHNIFFPEVFKDEKIKFTEDVRIAFLSDVHCGSDRHLGRNFERFLEWINSDDEVAKKVKYIFFVGDNVDGVGIFPGQESVLAEGMKRMEDQYVFLENYLRKIPKHITMFMCPGQHDACRVAEPQPVISERYAKGLYEIENLVLVSNPCYVSLLEGSKEFKVLMYHGASIHSFINEIKELRDMKAHRCPAKAVVHMLKRRHLAPMHGDVTYIPNIDKDPLVISEVPDVLCTGEVHKLDIENHNGVLIITGSCWQARTDYEEKVGNEPDPCKVPVLSLKTRELKVYDFTDDGEGND